MAVYLTPIDLNQNELRKARVQNLGSAPGTPVAGQLYYDTGTNLLYFYNGSSWVSAGGSTAPDATTIAKGIVQLAGDLAGTAASPQIATGAIILTDLNAALKPSGTAAAADEAVRALGTTASTALAGNTRLDQITAPTASVALNSQKITGLLDPTAAQDAATKAYVDATAQGLDVKASVVAATTAAGTLATSFENGDLIDGVTLATGNRILIKDQAAPADNGIYVVAASGAPTRATDFDAWAEVPGAFVFVEQGTVNADNGFVSTANAGGTLNTTAITWAQFSGAGQITAGAALTKTGNQLDVAVDNASIEVNADALRVKGNGITSAELAPASVDLGSSIVTSTLPIAKGGSGQTTVKAARETGYQAAGYYSSATHGAGTTVTITQATHGMRSSQGIVVQVQLVSTGEVVYADVAVSAGGDVTVTFAVSQGANTIRVTLIG